ncbi:MAG: tRNA uridine-5-carboxymethylaminomethyl(34) synthesis GTPase MnmE [Bacteroidetes bacterium]|nr:MAG: tRNA uridine-5-carboxymethylaminomethyl(34) synthesis GTPase MnmE [Bacteroidota bacterium]
MTALTKSQDSVDQKPAIAAIATPVGEGGIAVIRVSGSDAFEKVASCFRGADLSDPNAAPSHTVHYGTLVTPAGELVDEVLVTLFRSPRSYTGENTAEISCHGGVLVTQKVLETILSAGVRAAEPGEFTQRAFLNGKLDLTQAEAVADLIHAKSLRAVNAAGQQLEGRLGEHIRRFRQQIIDATAMVELELDFIEEDVEFANKEQLRSLLVGVMGELDVLLDTYEAGRLVKDGVRTVIMGRPNAGKSTLLNTLTGSDRAIVTEIAGTTRDTIDVDWSYEGLLFRLIDTAGIRETDDRVEAEGVRRSKKAFEQADLVVYLKDLSQPTTADELQELARWRMDAKDTPFLLVGTKADLDMAIVSGSSSPRQEQRLHYDLIISAVSGENINPLKKLMKERALEHRDLDGGSLLVTSTRHRDALQKAREHVKQALEALDMGLTGDLLAIDLRAALHDLGTVTGEITNEDLLDSIFSRFCIGK